MEKSQLYQVLSALSPIEQKRLLKFVQSPYHNNRKELVTLCELLLNHIKIGAPTRDKTYLYSKIYPNKKYDDKKMRYALSFLFDLVKNFLAIEQLNQDSVNKQLLLSEAIKSKGLQTQLKKTIFRAGQLLETQPFRHKGFLLYQHTIFYQQLIHNIKFNTDNNELSQQMSDALTAYLIASNLEVACASLTYASLKSASFELDFIQPILDFLEKDQRFLSYPAISIYYNAYLMLTKNQDEYFDKFYQNIKDAAPLFPLAELNNLFTIAINYCIKQINSVNLRYFKSLFDIYKEGLTNGVLLENGFMRPNTYINIVQTALKLKEYEWVKNFIPNFKNKVEPNLREQAYILNLAIFHNAKKEYQKVMRLLSTASFDETGMEVAARRMLLKIYFELNESEALYSLLDSFKNYIYRHKEIGYHKVPYLNLIKYTKKRVSLNPKNQVALNKLKSKIENTDQLADKKWLLAQF